MNRGQSRGNRAGIHSGGSTEHTARGEAAGRAQLCLGSEKQGLGLDSCVSDLLRAHSGETGRWEEPSEGGVGVGAQADTQGALGCELHPRGGPV